MNQPDLFDNPVVHAHGPSSEITPPHRERYSKCMRVLEKVRKYPGSTARELYCKCDAFFNMCGIDKIEGSRRLTDLKEKKFIIQGSVRRCQATGGIGVTWFPI